MSEIQRTADERFADSFGMDPGWPRVTGTRPVHDDERSDLWLLVRDAAKELGHDKADFLRRLHEAEAHFEGLEADARYYLIDNDRPTDEDMGERPAYLDDEWDDEWRASW